MREKDRQYYIEELTKDPLKWAGQSVNRIKELVEEGSHEVKEVYDHEVDPDKLVESNRKWLQGHLDLFKALDLTPPACFAESIALADEFLKDAA